MDGNFGGWFWAVFRAYYWLPIQESLLTGLGDHMGHYTWVSCV